MFHGSIGTISHGTLRDEDLLASFADELEYLVQRNADEWCSDMGRKHRDEYLQIVNDAREIEPGTDEAAELLNETLVDALQEFAPDYCYFGAHPGDGCDFGFWPDIESINELPHLTDEPNDERSFSEQAKDLGEDCKFVNDHGNVTVYSGNGSVLLELV